MVGVLVCSGCYHGIAETGCLKQQTLLTVLEAGALDQRGGIVRGWCRSPSWLCPHMAFLGGCTEKERSHVSASFCKCINPFMRTPPSWLTLTLITSQMSHLQIPSHGGTGFPHANSGVEGCKHSVRNRWGICIPGRENTARAKFKSLDRSRLTVGIKSWILKCEGKEVGKKLVQEGGEWWDVS